MKNYKVQATRYFRDSNEIDETTGLKKERQVNEEFYCTKERYEFLKVNNAVKLIEIQETIDDILDEEITEEQVQAVACAIVEEAQEQGKEVEEIVNEIIEEQKEQETEKKINKKRKK